MLIFNIKVFFFYFCERIKPELLLEIYIHHKVMALADILNENGLNELDPLHQNDEAHKNHSYHMVDNKTEMLEAHKFHCAYVYFFPHSPEVEHSIASKMVAGENQLNLGI